MIGFCCLYFFVQAGFPPIYFLYTVGFLVPFVFCSYYILFLLIKKKFPMYRVLDDNILLNVQKYQNRCNYVQNMSLAPLEIAHIC